MALNYALFVLITIISRTLAVPFASRPPLAISPAALMAGGIESVVSSGISVEVPSRYTPTLPPLEITVLPPYGASETVTITQAASTVTITSNPETSVITVAPIRTSADSSTSSASVFPQPTEWTLPSEFTSIDDAFNIEHYAFGRDNVQLSSVTQEDTRLDGNHLDDRTILEVTYPRGSYSPSHQPRGGTDFYATPSFGSRRDSTLDFASGSAERIESLKSASNVTLSYSVFFPATFDFVKGGKLPGLYGGHEKCSGGDDGLDCFSTRLMWRGGGKGELYLYAPKDQQAPSLCSTPPRSICDSAYGLSIGRGSFTFERGMWTYVSQTVWLNTPGRADGGFILEVANDNDPASMKTVMSNAEVFYRANEDNDGYLESASIDDIYGEEDEPGGPTYGPVNEWNPVQNILLSESILSNTGPKSSSAPMDSAKATVFVVKGTRTVTAPNYKTVTITKTLDGTPTPSSAPRSQSSLGHRSDPNEPSYPHVGFIGIFFSTFFGGSTPDWASTKDQSAWFKDFKVVVHA